MKKVLLLLALCGTGSFVMSMDGIIETGMDADGDDGNLDRNQSEEDDDRLREEERLANQEGPREVPRRAVSWGDEDPDEDGPVVQQDAAQSGSAAFSDAGQGSSADIAAANEANDENVDRGIALAPDRLAKINGGDDFWANQSEEDKGVVRRAVEKGSNDKVIQKLFGDGEHSLEYGENQEGMLKKLKRREQIDFRRREKREQAQANWGNLRDVVTAKDALTRAGRGELEAVRTVDTREILRGQQKEEEEEEQLRRQQLQQEREQKLDEIMRENPSLLTEEDRIQLKRDIQRGSQVDSLRHFLGEGNPGEFDSNMSLQDRLQYYRDDQDADEDDGQGDFKDLEGKTSFSSPLDMLERTPEEISEKIESIQSNIIKVGEDLNLLDLKGSQKGMSENDIEQMKKGFRDGIEKLKETQKYLRRILEMSPEEKANEVAQQINEELDTKIREFQYDRSGGLDTQTDLNRRQRNKELIESYIERLQSSSSHTLREELVLKRAERFLDAINSRRQELFTNRLEELTREANSNYLTSNQYETIDDGLTGLRKKIQERINELQAPQDSAQAREKQQLENKWKDIDVQKKQLAERRTDWGRRTKELSQEVDALANSGKNPTNAECQVFYNKINELYGSIGSKINELDVQEKTLGFKTKEVKKRSWLFGRTTIILEPDYSDVTDLKALQEIQERKQALEGLKRNLEAKYRSVEEVDPAQYTLSRWNRLSRSDRNRLNGQDLQLYSQGITAEDPTEEPKSKWWQFRRKRQTKEDALTEISRRTTAPSDNAAEGSRLE